MTPEQQETGDHGLMLPHERAADLVGDPNPTIALLASDVIDLTESYAMHVAHAAEVEAAFLELAQSCADVDDCYPDWGEVDDLDSLARQLYREVFPNRPPLVGKHD